MEGSCVRATLQRGWWQGQTSQLLMAVGQYILGYELDIVDGRICLVGFQVDVLMVNNRGE